MDSTPVNFALAHSASTDTATVGLWIASVVLLVAGAGFAVMNAVILVRNLRESHADGHHSSFGPLVGGVCLAAGFWLLPVSGVTEWWWCGLLLDFGCAPLLLLFAFGLVRLAWTRASTPRP